MNTRTIHCIVLNFILFLVACARSPERTDPEPWTPLDQSPTRYAVSLDRPSSSGRLTTELREVDNSPVGISCVTCHGAGTGKAFADHDKGNTEIHSNIALAHGQLSCGSCHTLSAPYMLHNSAGEDFPLLESQRLCSQCHGLIRQAYDHGAHGGMRGYWDLARGPRSRNDCITCHSPHDPTHPKVIPAPGPKDRNVYNRAHGESVIEMRFGGEKDE